MYPDWLDREDYPFKPKSFDLPAGRMSYVDEGSGQPIVLLHGNPYWSFEYRGLIAGLAGSFRCIAPDHIGFGLSDKPANWDYLPESHGANLTALLLSLDLKNIVLVVNDWGGPIGLSFAVEHPQRVAALVITNSWCWPVDDDRHFRIFGGFMGGPIGRALIRRRNFFATSVVKRAFGDKQKLTPELRRQIESPLDSPENRKGSWVFPREIIGSSRWLGTIWERRGVLAGKGRLIAWGDKDIAFREKELNRWQEAFPEARVVRYPDAGHFVAEEKPTELVTEILAAPLT